MTAEYVEAGHGGGAGEQRVRLGFFFLRACATAEERIPVAMRIEVREARTSTPERPLWFWNVFWGSREVGKGFCTTEEEANTQAKLAMSRAPRYY